MRLSALAVLMAAAVLGSSAARAEPAEATFDAVQAPPGVAFSPLADAAPMRVALLLPMRDRPGAEAYVHAVSQPGNALYGHFLRPGEFGARFGGDPATYERLRAWAAAQGLAVGERMEARTLLSLGGTAGQFARLFSTSFTGFATAEHGQGWVARTAPRLPAALRGHVEAVVGLSSAGQYGLRLHKRPDGAADVGTGLGGGYAPSDIRTAYDVPAQQGGATEVVGLFEQGGFFRQDVNKYQAQYGLPAIPVVARSVDGSATHPAPSGADVEAALDIDAVSGVNPALARIVVYIDGKDSFHVALIDAFGAMAHDDTAKVISVSYGLDERMEGRAAAQAENTALMQLAAQGQTVFVSSGDYGAAGRTGHGLNAPDPGSQPLVTCVGGTRLDTDPATQDWASEVVWNDASGATGGGVSRFWPIPDYQVVDGQSVAVANGGSSTMRNVPDIAADASPYTGYSIFSHSQGGWVVYGGTSLSAPLWAGFATIINAARVQAGQPRLGFFNPLLYPLGLTETGFHDIVKGNNGTPGFAAGPRYDNTTGFGSLKLARFLPTATQ